MDDDIVYSAPPSKSDEELEKGFVTAIIDQPKLLDELAKQLVTLGLAIPGLYATVLKFIGGDDAVVKSSWLIIGAFACWFIALALSLFSLRPRKWKVDRSKLCSNKPAAPGQHFGLLIVAGSVFVLRREWDGCEDQVRAVARHGLNLFHAVCVDKV